MSHDLGGNVASFGSINTANKSVLHWEQQCHALVALLAKKGLIKTDELRYTIEGLTPSQYNDWSYYERWSAGLATCLLDKGFIRHDELRLALLGPALAANSKEGLARFLPGDYVRVLKYHEKIQWRRPHIRTPGYIYGVSGVVKDVCGAFEDPSFLSLGLDSPKVWLYRVAFQMKDVWPEHESSSEDAISVELYEHWLEASNAKSGHDFADAQLFDHNEDGRDCTDNDQSSDHSPHHHHHHGNDDGEHSHDPRPLVEFRAFNAEGPPRPGKELHQALTSILLDRQIITDDDLRRMMEVLESAGEQLLGASLVVEAWLDPAFQERLLQNPTEAAQDLGIVASNPNAPTVLSVVANSPDVHNLVVCTLCSCYPSSLLGIAPSWYKSCEYRARAVREPRKVLKEFGTRIDASTRIHVHDSTADHRYLVLPQRPLGTDGWSREELRAIVTRDCMIGVTIPQVS